MHPKEKPNWIKITTKPSKRCYEIFYVKVWVGTGLGWNWFGLEPVCNICIFVFEMQQHFTHAILKGLFPTTRDTKIIILFNRHVINTTQQNAYFVGCNIMRQYIKNMK